MPGNSLLYSCMTFTAAKVSRHLCNVCKSKRNETEMVKTDHKTRYGHYVWVCKYSSSRFGKSYRCQNQNLRLY